MTTLLIDDEFAQKGGDRLLLDGLLHGIAAIQNQRMLEGAIPKMRELCALVRANWNRDELERALWGVEAEVGFQIDLWPDHAAMTDDDMAERTIIRDGLTQRNNQAGFPRVQPIYNELRAVNYSERRLAD